MSTPINPYPEGSFLHWYWGGFHNELQTVEVPEMPPPLSWDRKAAYLLWCARGHDPKNIGVPPLKVPKQIEGKARRINRGEDDDLI